MEKMPRGIIRSTLLRALARGGGPGRDARRTSPSARSASCARATSRLEDLARVSVKNHAHGVHNPNAMYRKPITVEAVLASPRRLRAAAPPHAVLAERRRRGGRAVGHAAGGWPARPRPRRRAALASRRQRPRRAHAALRPRRRRGAEPDRDGRDATPTSGPASAPAISTSSSCRTPTPAREILSAEELGLCPPRRRRPLGARRRRRDDVGAAGEPERRPPLEGRAARRVRARRRSSSSSWQLARHVPAHARCRTRGSASPTRSDAAPTRAS